MFLELKGEGDGRKKVGEKDHIRENECSWWASAQYWGGGITRLAPTVSKYSLIIKLYYFSKFCRRNLNELYI